MNSNICKTITIFEENLQLLNELQMKPNSLINSVMNSEDVTVGIEYEMAVQMDFTVITDDYEAEYSYSDYEYDNETFESIRDAISFFSDDNSNYVRDYVIDYIRDQSDFEDWYHDRIYDIALERYESDLQSLQDSGASEDEIEEFENDKETYVSDILGDIDLGYDDYNEYIRNNEISALDIWIFSNQDLTWPFSATPPDGITEDQALAEVAQTLSSVIGKPVDHGSYGSARHRGYRSYTLETDSSIEASESQLQAELVSPPQTIAETMKDMMAIIRWAKQRAETNDSTGLHVNLSISNFENIDWFKALLFLGDNYILKLFDRESNRYAKSTMTDVIDTIGIQGLDSAASTSAEELSKDAQLFQAKMQEFSKNLMRSKKYQSMHLKDAWIEFRSPGGDWLTQDPKTILSTIARFAVVMKIAADPNAYKKEYYKKIYQLINKTSYDINDTSPNPAISVYKEKLQNRLHALSRQVLKQADQDEWYRISRFITAITDRKQLAQVASMLTALEKKIANQS